MEGNWRDKSRCINGSPYVPYVNFYVIYVLPKNFEPHRFCVEVQGFFGFSLRCGNVDNPVQSFG
jgi:hypothetical protein